MTQIHESHRLFRQYPLADFRKYDAEMIQFTSAKKAQRDDQQEAFERHCLAFPRGLLTERGVPYWDTHPAKKMLEEDVKCYSSEPHKLKPAKLRETRVEYKSFSLKKFGERVHAEKKRQRTQPFWQQSAKKIAIKKREEDLEEMKKDWMENDINGEVDRLAEDCKARLNMA